MSDNNRFTSPDGASVYNTTKNYNAFLAELANAQQYNFVRNGFFMFGSGSVLDGWASSGLSNVTFNSTSTSATFTAGGYTQQNIAASGWLEPNTNYTAIIVAKTSANSALEFSVVGVSAGQVYNLINPLEENKASTVAASSSLLMTKHVVQFKTNVSAVQGPIYVRIKNISGSSKVFELKHVSVYQGLIEFGGMPYLEKNQHFLDDLTYDSGSQRWIQPYDLQVQDAYVTNGAASAITQNNQLTSKEYVDTAASTPLQDHINDPTSAHMATAIGSNPVYTGLAASANNVENALKDLKDLIGSAPPAEVIDYVVTASDVATGIIDIGTQYVTGGNYLNVFFNQGRLTYNVDYEEFSTASVKFLFPLTEGDYITFITNTHVVTSLSVTHTTSADYVPASGIIGPIDYATRAGSADIAENANYATLAGSAEIAGMVQSIGQSLLVGYGYQVLPSGLILQWGNATTQHDLWDITFPIAFPNAAFLVCPSDGDGYANLGYMNLTTTKFTVRTNVPNIFYSWLAVGY